MKRFLIICLGQFLTFLALNAFAAGTCVPTIYNDGANLPYLIRLACTGDASDGSVTYTLRSDIWKELKRNGYVLTNVCAFPTPAGTAPGTAETLTITDSQSLDILGGKGTIIPTSGKECTNPYNSESGLYEFYDTAREPTNITVNGTTGTAGQNYTVDLFCKK